ncbi:MAG: hypothetical protein ACYS8I_12625 [Planctomycetota bacterium]|jgi:hypothetical protein
MAITTTWTVTLQQYNDSIDVTSRTYGATINQEVSVGAVGVSTATIEIDNNDGAFTPFNGGTYSNVDFFAYALIIDVTVSDGVTNYQRNVYGGVINDFKLNDNGTNSTVTLSAVDGITIAGRSEIGYANLNPSLYFASTMRGAITLLLDGWTSGGNVLLEEVQLPYLGGDDIDTQNVRRDLQAYVTTFEFYGYENYTVADILNSSILPSAPGVQFPGEIRFETVSGTDTTRYRNMIMDTSLVPDATYQKTFVFAENPTGTELPFKNLDRGYNMGDVVNAAQVTRNDPTQFGGAPTETKSYESTVSIQKYGVRAVEYGTLAIRWDDETVNFGVTEPGAQQVAERWANRYDTPRFLTKRLTVTAKQVDAVASSTAAEQWADYLHCETGLWNIGQVIYTPTGGTERTDDVVVASRKINITPQDAVVTVYCLPLNDNMSFVLDSSTLGVLDTNRLG